MRHITPNNIHSFCRTCLAELSDKSETLGEKYDINETENLSKWILTCTLMDVAKSDDYPKFVCQQCYQKLQCFHEFRWSSMRALRIMTDILKKKDLNLVMHMENISDSGCDSEEQIRDDQESVLEEIYGNKDWLEFSHDTTSDLNQRRSQEKLQNSLENAVMKTLTESKELPLDEDSSEKSESEDIEMPEVNLQVNANMRVHRTNGVEQNVLESLDITIRTNESESEEKDCNSIKRPRSLSATSNPNSKKIKTSERIKARKKIPLITNPKRVSTDRNEKKSKLSKLQMSAKQASAKFQCDRCPRRCVTRDNFDAHMRTHQGLKPFVCKVCGRSFNRADHLREHERELHTPNRKEIICAFEGCGKVFRREATYKVHYRLKHVPEYKQREQKTYVCEDCGRTFKNITILKEHRYKHLPEEEYPYKCDDCGKHYRSQRTYKEHLLRHAGIKNFECQYCGMKKTTRNELRTHINYHTKEKTWPCTLCSSVFNSSANLGMHDRVVHKGIKKYACRYCDQSFGKQDTLKHHEMRHTGEKPHVCHVCNKRFIQVVALRAHMKTHNKNGKPPENVCIQNCQDVVAPNVETSEHAIVSQELVTNPNAS